MGTRGAIGFFKNGKGKVTYNHWDSYPDELGIDILEELRGCSIKQLNLAFKNIHLVKESKSPTDKQIEECKKFADLGVSGQNYKEWYCLLRNSQGTLKPYIDFELKYMIDGENFLKDSLFCEWAYIVNLDKNVLEVWQGFQKTPQENRYKMTKEEIKKEEIKKEEKSNKSKLEYFNCKLIAEYPLEEGLPCNKRFLEDIKSWRIKNEILFNTLYNNRWRT